MDQAQRQAIAGRACAVILAGGQGSRIRHLYPSVPKPLIPAAGQPFIEWVIAHLASQGISRFVISLGHLSSVAEAYFSRRPRDETSITTVCEPAPLGTGGAFLWAERACCGASWLLLANGDSLVLADLEGVWRHMDDDRIDGVVVGLEMDHADRYGRLEIDRAGRLLRFCEKQPGRGLINAGLYCFRRSLLAEFPRRTPLSMELDVFPSLLRAGARLSVYVARAPFLDIGTPQTVQESEGFIRAHFQQRVAG